MFPFAFSAIRRAALLLLVAYAALAALLYARGLRHDHEPAPDFGFIKRKPVDGPLVVRDDFFEETGQRRVIGGVVLLDAVDVDSGKPPIRRLNMTPIGDLEMDDKFMKDFLNQSKAIHNKHDLVLYTLVNDAYLNLTLNWLCNTAALKEESVHDKTIFVTLGEKTCARIKKEWPSVACMEMRADPGYDAQMDWGSTGYARLLEARLKQVLTLVEADLNVVVFETDAVWFKNPLKLFRNALNRTDVDLTIPVNFKETNGQKFSFDPMCVRPTYGAKQALKEILKSLKRSGKLMDQDLLNARCARQSLKCGAFKWAEVADGKWFKMSQKERKSHHPFVVHNNYYMGARNKMGRQAMSSGWFLSNRGVCQLAKAKKTLSGGRT